jgi:hypothetical protein
MVGGWWLVKNCWFSIGVGVVFVGGGVVNVAVGFDIAGLVTFVNLYVGNQSSAFAILTYNYRFFTISFPILLSSPLFHNLYIYFHPINSSSNPSSYYIFSLNRFSFSNLKALSLIMSHLSHPLDTYHKALFTSLSWFQHFKYIKAQDIYFFTFFCLC